MTSRKMMTISMEPGRERSFSAKVVLGPAGPQSGWRRHRYQTVPRKREVSRMPGTMPPTKRLAMDWLVWSPMMISTTDGGMTTPRVAPAATDPADRIGLYLNFFISGRATVDMVAAVAELEPQMAANPAQARMVVMDRPPRISPIQA
jgi:hypothetical protein